MPRSESFSSKTSESTVNRSRSKQRGRLRNKYTKLEKSLAVANTIVFIGLIVTIVLKFKGRIFGPDACLNSSLVFPLDLQQTCPCDVYRIPEYEYRAVCELMPDNEDTKLPVWGHIYIFQKLGQDPKISVEINRLEEGFFPPRDYSKLEFAIHENGDFGNCDRMARSPIWYKMAIDRNKDKAIIEKHKVEKEKLTLFGKKSVIGRGGALHWNVANIHLSKSNAFICCTFGIDDDWYYITEAPVYPTY